MSIIIDFIKYIGYANILSLTAFILALAAFVTALIVDHKKEKENENFINFPKMGDAFQTGWYRTLGRECKPNLYKCKAKQQTWCSENKDCSVSEHNLQGQLMKEPMTWFDRFV